MVHDDIVLAQRVVSIAESNLDSDKFFHAHSSIYLTSNEFISGFQKYLNNRERIISVIASGDQILNCILGGTKIIDSFDISIFPKYFLRLKMAAIQGLSREEYIDFFFGSIRPDEKYNDMYERIRVFLEGESLEFWDSLFDFYEWYDIINSTLFSSEPFHKARVVDYNTYLQKDNYRLLSKMIKDVDISTFEGDILDIYSSFKGSYDLVYLSNIIYYTDVKRYRELLDKFNLRDQGIILTYLFFKDYSLVRMFRDEHIEFNDINGAGAALMTYHR